jgi:hypothetical protein
MRPSTRSLAAVVAAALLSTACKRQVPPDVRQRRGDRSRRGRRGDGGSSFTAQEGQRLTADAVVGSIDATDLALQHDR